MASTVQCSGVLDKLEASVEPCQGFLLPPRTLGPVGDTLAGGEEAPGWNVSVGKPSIRNLIANIAYLSPSPSPSQD